MRERDRKHVPEQQVRPAAGASGEGQGSEQRDRAEALADRADAILDRVLSRDSERFLRDGRQQGGQ